MSAAINSGGVAEVPVSANRSVDSSSPVAAFGRQVVEQALPHGRDGVQPLGAVTHDGRTDLLGGGRLHVDDAVTGVPLLEGDGPRRHVEHRKHAHGPSAWLELRTGVGAQHAGPVGEHHTLGPAGRAAGEEHDVGVGLPQGRIGWRGQIGAGEIGERRQGGGRQRRRRSRRPDRARLGRRRRVARPPHRSPHGRRRSAAPTGRPPRSTWTASSFVSSGLIGQNTAPMAAQPTTTGTSSSAVADQTTTRSPLPMPRACSRAPTARPRSWISRKVSERSPSAAAIRSGTATAACSKMSPTSSSTFPSSIGVRTPSDRLPVLVRGRPGRGRRPQARHDSRNVVTGGVTTVSPVVPSFWFTSAWL